MRLYLAGDERDIYPGVYARAHFAIGQARKLVIPAQSVVRRSEVSGVYVVNEKGNPSFRQIRLGESAGEGLVEVLAGVSAGEKVALEPIKAGMADAVEARRVLTDIRLEEESAMADIVMLGAGPSAGCRWPTTCASGHGPRTR